jgi:molecular chaperone DnaK
MIVGIDLGTTNSAIGAVLDGFPILFADGEGRRLTPSVVASDEAGNLVAGHAAATAPIRSVKRLMGMRYGDAGTPRGARPGPGGGLLLEWDGHTLSPEEISAVILRKLKADAEGALGQEVREAVITVPAYFNDAQRAATKRAGELAGLEVRRLLPEPTAAALAFGLEKLGSRSRVAVFDLGGGTFDLSILELAEGVFHVLATHGDTQLGGDDLDAAIAAALGVSTHQAEALKRNPPPDLISRIAEACMPVLARTRTLCERALLDSGLARHQLDAVVLVGGATRMPVVRELVADIFGRQPDTSQHPDEAVAIGAALQAGILDGSLREVTLLDVTPLSLGIETFGGLMNVLIPRNTTIPTKAGELFTNAASGQTAMSIRVLQGERELAKDNWQLGECTVPFPPAPKGQARVGVQFELDVNGILHVLARDLATGKDTTLDIRSAIEASDEAVEKMLEDALEHAFEDMDDRRFAEAKLKADEMLPAVEAALASHPPEDPAELAAIHTAQANAKKALASGSHRELTGALEALDQATAPLAARILGEIVGDAR